MNEVWFRPYVWMDFRLALLLAVAIPLILLVWALVKNNEPIQRLLAIYWRVASLLVISLYLAIGALPIAFASGFLARLLIPLSLWFWVDLNEEIQDQPNSPLKLGLSVWRWAATLYNLVGALAMLPFLRCSFLPTQQIVETPTCTVWLEVPWRYREIFHSANTPQFLGFIGILGLTIYILYFVYFVVFRITKQGRYTTSP
mgnify:CR=1 FL=1